MDRPPIEIERRRTPHSSPGRGGQRPRAIVVHTTDGGFAAAAAWFAAAESGVSAHYLVGLDGRVAQFVDEADTARHAGRVLRPTATLARGRDDLNPITVGIELEDGGDPEGIERPEAQYEAAAALVAAVCERWEIPLDREHVIGHREVFAAKACPGNVDLERLVAMARSAPRPAEEMPGAVAAEPPLPAAGSRRCRGPARVPALGRRPRGEPRRARRRLLGRNRGAAPRATRGCSPSSRPRIPHG